MQNFIEYYLANHSHDVQNYTSQAPTGPAKHNSHSYFETVPLVLSIFRKN